MPTVRLGNTAPKHPVLEGVEDPHITEANIPDSYTHRERMHNVLDPAGGWWDQHSSDHPAWVESDDPALERALSAYFDCPIGRPDDWA